METSDFYGTEKVSRILLKIAPPVMLAQLIQALYNIVDSVFVSMLSENALTAVFGDRTYGIVDHLSGAASHDRTGSGNGSRDQY